MLQRLVDAAAVEAEIERVRSLSGAALRRRWQAEFGRPLPRSPTVELLRRMIANRIQEEAFGTLDRATLKLLDGLARRDRSRRGERNLKRLYDLPCSGDFSPGRGGLLQLLGMSLPPCCRFHPAEVR